jgi:hypothetical protein
MEPARGEAVMSADRVGPVDSESGVEAEHSPGAARVLGPYHKWAVLALVAVGAFMSALDASIVNVGLPSIARTFRTPIGGAVEWVIIIYLVVVAGTLLTFGRRLQQRRAPLVSAQQQLELRRPRQRVRGPVGHRLVGHRHLHRELAPGRECAVNRCKSAG